MQQAVLITAYTNIEHLNNIVDSLDNDFLFYIHIDKKNKIDKRKVEELATKKNVLLVSEHYNVNWGGINHLKAILLLLEKALANKSTEYFHLITGHDYPIKTASDITSFLERNKGKEYLEYFELPYDKWENGGYDRLIYYNLYDFLNARKGWRNVFVRQLYKLQRRLHIKRGFADGFPGKLYGGSTYWTLSRECIEYVFGYMQENPMFLRRFKYSFCSEEIFFQTVILNSPLKENVVNSNMRFIVWEERNGNFPANLDDSDFDNIINSEALFARKFDFPVSQNLLENITLYLNKEHV